MKNEFKNMFHFVENCKIVFPYVLPKTNCHCKKNTKKGNISILR